MTSRVLGILAAALGFLLLFKFVVSSTALFLIAGLLIAVLTGTGQIGRTGWVLAGIFLMLGLAGSTLRLAIGTVALLFRMAPILLILVGIYAIAKSIRR